MARQSFDLGNWLHQGRWQGSILIQPSLTRYNADLYLRQVAFLGNDVEIIVGPQAGIPGSPLFRGGQAPLSDALINAANAIRFDVAAGAGLQFARTLKLNGPAHPDNFASDAREPYRWTPYGPFVHSVNAFSAHANGRAVTMTFDDHSSAAVAVAELTGGLSGSIEGAAILGDAPGVDAAGTLTGGLSGSIEGAAVLGPESFLDTAGTLTGGLSGSIQGAASVVTVLDPAIVNRINAFSLSGFKPIFAIRIEHPAIEDDVLAVNDRDPAEIEGDMFPALAFTPVIPQRKEREIPRGQLIVTNVGRPVMEWVERSRGGREAKVTYYSVIFEDPNSRAATVVWKLSDMDIANIVANSQKVIATISEVESVRTPAVKVRHDPLVSPGIF